MVTRQKHAGVTGGLGSDKSRPVGGIVWSNQCGLLRKVGMSAARRDACCDSGWHLLMWRSSTSAVTELLCFGGCDWVALAGSCPQGSGRRHHLSAQELLCAHQRGALPRVRVQLLVYTGAKRVQYTRLLDSGMHIPRYMRGCICVMPSVGVSQGMLICCAALSGAAWPGNTVRIPCCVVLGTGREAQRVFASW